MSQAILFEGEQTDVLPDLSKRPRHLSGSKLLWVDLDAPLTVGIAWMRKWI